MKNNPTAKRNIHGYIIVSDIIGGYWEHKTYIGYTMRQAIQLFKSEFKDFYRN